MKRFDFMRLSSELVNMGIIFILLAAVCGALGLLAHYLSQYEQGEVREVSAGFAAGKESGAMRVLPGPKNGCTEKESDENAEREQAEDPKIRVCITNSNYSSDCHERLTIQSEGTICIGKSDGYIEKNGEVIIRKSDLNLSEHWTVAASEGKTLMLPELKRAQGIPAYSGVFHIYRKEEGLFLVNELSLEEYLRSVVPSEMPSDYPEQALLAQAVCARTFAWNCICDRKNEDQMYDLDDSVSFQVYNNQKGTVKTDGAVRKTAGEILSCRKVQYYSTDCGAVGRTDLGNEKAFADFIRNALPEEREYGSPWLRWNLVLTKTDIFENIRRHFDYKGTSVEILEVIRRGEDGQVLKLGVSDGTEEMILSGEYDIRLALAPDHTFVTLKNGQEITGQTLLPSAWFCFDTEDLCDHVEEREIRLSGGGYGHGNGMSQCGAAQKAADGADYREILDYYYGESELLHVS